MSKYSRGAPTLPVRPLLTSSLMGCEWRLWTQSQSTPRAICRRHVSNKASSRQWLDRHVNDSFVKKAHGNGKISRAYYKLEFMDQKYGLFNSNKTSAVTVTKGTTQHQNESNDNKTIVVVDLGAAPGGWTQYASEQQQKQREKAIVWAIDLLELDPNISQLPLVHFLQGDFTEFKKQIGPQNLFPLTNAVDNNLKDQDLLVKLVLSDMAPNFIGDSRTDAMRTALLCEEALEYSCEVLHRGGNFVGKFFSGPEEKTLKDLAREEFTKVVTVKPPASRAESAERYLVALDRRA